MLDLQELQIKIANTLLSGDVTALTGEITAPGANPTTRFQIYRNNMFLSLARHLKAVFPVTARVGDERFFVYAAREFIRSHPPREPHLSTYGGDFAKFLASFPPSRNVRLLVEMAAFEWAVHCALIAAERPPLAAAALARVSGDSGQISVALQPSLGFVLARWPVLVLWAAEGRNDDAIKPKLNRIALFRRGDNIRVLELKSASFGFWRNLQKGVALDCAAARALARNPQFNLVNEIHRLFNAGLVTALYPPEIQRQGGQL
jgi:hypothetical protein